ncbi:CAP domain-containing protein [Strongyloides ratti]|uniref:CAP domain-containing protein n=1 Tax=Strongyloides ratti TaxID=34506 RepID=A0A090LEV3_STRRB|nr:CAP domain-containing protein [Strongyloides ratti]CEF68272.1 CAP domain-containing protein [Strongyloides ratti]
MFSSSVLINYYKIIILLAFLTYQLSSKNISQSDIISRPKRLSRLPPKYHHVYPSIPIDPLPKSKHPSADKGKFYENALRKYVVDLHNQYRAKHHAPPLRYSTNLEVHATKYAQLLAEWNEGLIHDEYNYYQGENLFSIHQKWIPDEWELAKITMNTFYEELKYYNYNKYNPKDLILYGHFSQLVWYDSRNIGIGFGTVKVGKGYKIYICMRYDPPGNVMRAWQFKRNVLRP